MLKCRYFFRASAGPGWALLGDAGHHKEFVVGLGISDALRDAHALAAAVLERESHALERWWRRRDVERIEMFHWACDLGRAQPVNALQRLTVERLALQPELHGRFGEIIDGRRSPYDLVPASDAARWVAAAALRGDLRPLPHLLAAARRRVHASLVLRASPGHMQRAERQSAAHPATGYRRPDRAAAGPAAAG
jgi:hypothetical protein